MPLPPPPAKRADRLALEKIAKNQSSTRKSKPVQQTGHQTQAADTTRDRVSVQGAKPISGAQPAIAPQALLESATVRYLPVVGHRSAKAVRSTQVQRRRSSGPAKLFVLDTNVLLHDPICLFRFEEHDIFLPMIVLEELDGHKKGMTEVARNARQTSRTLDALAAQPDCDITQGLALNTTGHIDARGKLLFQTEPLHYTLPASLPQGKADNQILGVVEALRSKLPGREVVLVSKDINMRVKARALGLNTDDYKNDKTLEDGDLLYSGALALPTDFWASHGQAVESWQQGPHTFYKVDGPVVPEMYINQFVYFEAPGEPSLYARVTEIRGTTAILRTLKDFNHLKNAVWGVTARNREQNFALNLLMDPEIDFVTILGPAG